MGDMEETSGWEEAPKAARLGFSAGEVADAALVQDEIDYAARMAVDEAAAMRHFGKDPRDIDPRDLDYSETL